MASRFEEFCGGPFWKNENTKTLPNFTDCFRLTVLSWAPAVFFWLLAPIFLLQISRVRVRKYKPLPWSLIFFIKAGLTIILILDAIFFCIKYFIDKSNGKDISTAYIVFPIIWVLTMICILFFQFLCKFSGSVSSGIIHLTFIVHAICGAPEFYSYIQKISEKHSYDSLRCCAYFIWYLCVLVQVFAQCFADPRVESKIEEESDGKKSKELDSSFVNRLTLWWYTRIPLLGAKKDLEMKDLFLLNPGSSSSYLVPLWEKFWIPTVKKYNEKKKSLIKQLKCFEKNPMKNAQNIEKIQKQLRKLEPPSIAGNLFQMFKFELISAMAIKVVSDTIQFVNPFILHELIGYISKSNGDLWTGISYAVGMFIASELRSFLFNYHNYIMFRMSVKIQNVLISAVYKKTLCLSNIARRDKTIGEIVNLMAIDVERFQTLTPMIQLYWSAPYQCTLALVYLYIILGYSALPGIVVMVLFIPLNIFCSRWVRGWNMRQMKLKDERAKMCNEVLNGIKVIKFYAWEIPMKNMIERIRKLELTCILKSTLVRNSVDVFNVSSPFLVGFISFLTFTLSDKKHHILTPQIAFVSLTLFNLLRQPMMQIGQLIQQTVQAIVSNKRLKDFLVAEELDRESIQRSLEVKNEKPVVDVKNGYFSWEDSAKNGNDSLQNIEEFSKIGNLHDINLQLSPKNLIAVVGKVGSGKSSLLSALLGEMEKLHGQINILGQLAYVPQQAWIQNLPLRNNILFGRPYDKDLYESVIDACALRPDLAILPNGDVTEIGEKGINLSGGQKARVSLARAVYQNYDVYLLDDPLSAVDSHVGKHIFDKVIGPNGMLRNKTRILVTHGINHLKDMDLIVHIDNGRIIDIGTYEELISHKEKFAKLIEDAQSENHNENMSSSNDSAYAETFEDAEISLVDEEDVDMKERFIRQISTISAKVLGRHSDSSSDKQLIFADELQQKLKRDQKLIQKERVETGRVKMSVYSQYAKSATYKRSFSFLTMFVMYAVVQMLRNVWLSDWSDDEAKHNGHHTKVSLGERLSIYAALGFGESFFLACSLLSLILGGLKASQNLHGPLLYNILRSPMSFFDTTPIGRVLNRFGKDIDVCDSSLPANFRYVTMTVISIISTLLIIIITNPIFGVVVVPLIVVYIYSLRYYVPTSRQLKRLESTHRSPIYSHFGETIQGAPTIRAFGKTDDFIEMCYTKVDAFVRIKYMSIVANRWLAVRLEFIGNSVVLFAALFGVLSHEWGWLESAGLLGLSVSYALNITNNLNQFTRQLGDLETNIVAVERIKEYTDIPNEAPWTIQGILLPPNWPSHGSVQIKNYATRYRPGLDLVIKNIDAVINPSERVGIVGRTGAGKSSLTLALFRMIEAAEGKIIIDGVEISQIGLHDLRANLTIIPQDPVLFSGTLRFNLDPFDKYSDDEIWLALELAHLKEFAKSLPNGLNHTISEGGDNISVGQRQLVCLARALLRRSRILILDEATAAVDLATDALIQMTIRTEFRNSTVITIAHRLNTILDYDRVMVLDKGEIQEFDTPQNLLSDANSTFSKMIKDAKIQNKS